MTQTSRNKGNGSWLDSDRRYRARKKQKTVAPVTPTIPATSGEFIVRNI